MIVVMVVVTGLAGLGLAAVNDRTSDLIAQNARQTTLKSINTVLPETGKPDACKTFPSGFDNAPDQDTVCIDGMTVFRGRRGSEVTGIAVQAIGEKAYAGTMTVLVGLRMSDGMLTGIKVLKHAETPGLGTGMTKCEFQRQMVGFTPDGQNWTVAKDGGDIDQLSGATITSRSLLNAVTKAQTIWKSERDRLLSAPAMKEGEVCHGQ